MAEIDVPKVNVYAHIGVAQGSVGVVKLNVYAIVNGNAPPAPPRRHAGVALNYRRVRQ